MKKGKIFKSVVLLVFTCYIIVYIISISSYYDYQLQKKTILTNEQIKLFESKTLRSFDTYLTVIYKILKSLMSLMHK